jgi:hypothetical protein
VTYSIRRTFCELGILSHFSTEQHGDPGRLTAITIQPYQGEIVCAPITTFHPPCAVDHPCILVTRATNYMERGTMGIIDAE